MPAGCYFCDRLEGTVPEDGPVVYEDAVVRVVHPVAPGGASYVGVLQIVLRRHGERGVADLSDEEGERFGRLVARAGRALVSSVGAAWTYTYAFTEGHRHAHQFVVARYPSMPPEHARLEALRWPGAPRAGRDEIGRLAERLRPFLAGDPATDAAPTP